MTYYVIGWNTTGYLPEMDPYPAEDADAARMSMREELDRLVDDCAERTTLDADPEVQAVLVEDLEDAERLLAEIATADVSDGWDGYVGHYHYWITREDGAMPEPEDC